MVKIYLYSVLEFIIHSFEEQDRFFPHCLFFLLSEGVGKVSHSKGVDFKHSMYVFIFNTFATIAVTFYLIFFAFSYFRKNNFTLTYIRVNT